MIGTPRTKGTRKYQAWPAMRSATTIPMTPAKSRGIHRCSRWSAREKTLSRRGKLLCANRAVLIFTGWTYYAQRSIALHSSIGVKVQSPRRSVLGRIRCQVPQGDQRRQKQAEEDTQGEGDPASQERIGLGEQLENCGHRVISKSPSASSVPAHFLTLRSRLGIDERVSLSQKTAENAANRPGIIPNAQRGCAR